MRPAVTAMAMLAPVVLLLASCGVLFAPMEERSNPLDPKAQLVTLSLAPDLLGSVAPSAPSWNPDVLSISSVQYGVLRFVLTGLPDVVTLAQLTLECSGGTFQRVELYPILQPWDPMYVDIAQMTSAGFLTSAAAATGDVIAAGPWVFELTQAIRAGMKYGVAIKGTASGFLDFYPTGTLAPRLYIEGYNN